ncbi:RDD family protein [Brachybacterium massiliense]|uniref:RDD family protein n=1 Tax=Brachybacterium massiliense TaxID=1755098 RepID=UPI000B3BC4BA|nr:RDD family protein [Brachybacterium massiliense]
MNQTRYCSTCGSLLSQSAAICGECGARYQESPYERRATDAPGAWSQAPMPRRRDLGSAPEQEGQDEGIELVSRESLEPKAPGATSLRSQEQYDQLMVTQSPMHQPGPGSASGAPEGPGSPAGAPRAGAQMEPPLDGCAPASPLKRFLAALVDSVLVSLVTLPLLIGSMMLLLSESIGLLPQILIGVGVALPAAYTVLIIWLVGAKGFSIGKLILGLRVTRYSAAGPIGFVRSLGRWFLYGLIPLIMALSIFIDPKKHLRGVHDRAVDSVVVDLKEGRNPLKPRPDDFEREGAEHYLGAPSVAVSTHQNLLAEPGAAWQDESSGEPAQPSVQGAGAWGEPQQMAPSPYAPPSSSASAPEAPMPSTGWDGQPVAQNPSVPSASGDGGWAPPPVDPVPPAPSWDEPAGQTQGWNEPEPQPQWGQPSPAPQPEWGQPSPAPQPEWSQQSSAPQPEWGQPSPAPQPEWDAQPAQSWDQPIEGQPSAPQAPAADAAQGWAPPAPAQHPAPVQEPAPVHDPAPNAPSELTADAWDSGVDEQTRLTAPEGALGDLEQTRLSPARLPQVKQLRLTTDDGAERVVDKAVVIGRNPSAPGTEVLFVMKDDTRSVSKTHLLIDGTGEDITVTDLGSTNGSAILREDGSRESLVPNSPTVLPTGAQLTLGDRTLSVERTQ